MRITRLCSLLVVLTVFTGWAASRHASAGEELSSEVSAPSEAEALEFFERKVRPILVQRCHECHGENEQKGGLRLDSRAAIVAGGDTGPAIEPGAPSDSLLVDAIRYGDTYQMPPKSQLPEAEIAALTRWVEIGAPWPAGDGPSAARSGSEFNLAERAKHWAFQPLLMSAPPPVKNTAWPSAAFDAFILAQLEANEMTPAPATDKRSWLRRVTYDLIGLPPTREEIATFLADESPTAYEKVVDRLLASPAHGERWARHWLDLVRYAETHGHEFDYDIPNAYRYRDYLIRAFNSDVPYDQLVLEHVAGDLLTSPRVNAEERWNESILGTGFFWLGEAKHSPVDARQDEAERIDNQIDVFAKTFLGLTVSCARCHDHKFDAISTKDYYALAGYLQSSRYQQAFIDLPEVFEPSLVELTALRTVEQTALEQALAQHTPDRASAEALFDRLANDEELKRAREQSEHPLHTYAILAATPENEFAARKEQLAQQLAGSSTSPRVFQFVESLEPWIATGQAFGDRPARTGERLTATHGEGSVTRVAPDAAAHSGLLSDKLRGVLRSPTFTIDQPKLFYRLYGTGGRVRLILDGLQLIQDPIYGGLQFSPRTDRAYWHTQDVSKWVGHRAYIELIDEGDHFLALERVTSGAADASAPREPIDDAVVAAIGDPQVNSLAELRGRYVERIEAALRNEKAGGSLAAQAILLALEGTSEQQSFRDLSGRRREIESRIPLARQAPALADGSGENEHVFIRGNHKQLGDEVARRSLEVLSGVEQPAPTSGSGRQALAQRLIADSGHLVARVMVNRVWKHHFGVGLVSTPDDFGVMGQPPSHPELLDYLAAEFMREGWLIKALHRQMVLSSTYRMQSVSDAKYDELDPRNRLWHHMPVVRLEAEAVRDAMLAVSGRLDPALYGPSIPPHLTDFMQGRGRPTSSGPADGAGRRSIYLGVRRNFLSPMLLAFDYPTPFTTIGRRTVSNVPAQALTLLNNPFVHEHAELWSKRALAENHGSDARRVHAMYEQAFGRRAMPEEESSALAFLAERRAADGGNAQRAWIDLAHVLFNVKEFIFLK